MATPTISIAPGLKNILLYAGGPQHMSSNINPNEKKMVGRQWQLLSRVGVSGIKDWWININGSYGWLKVARIERYSEC